MIVLEKSIVKAAPLVTVLVQQLEEAYHRRAWHGTNLRGSLKGITIEQLVHRPGKDRHNIWEIAVHCAYWKYTVRRRLTGGHRGSFPLAGSNFFRRPEEPTLAAWKRDLRLLNEMHGLLVKEVSKLSPRDLLRNPGGSKYTAYQMITGVAMHDVYHAGQIQLLKRLM